MNDPYNKSYPYPQQPQPGYAPAGYPPAGYQQGLPPPYATGPGGAGPQIGFVNPSYPMPQGSGFVPLVQPQQPFPPMPNPHHAGAFIDPENPEGPEIKGFDFTEQSVRKGFIRKVYSIILVQLSVTLLFIVVLNCNKKNRAFVQRNPALMIVAFIVSFATLIAMGCVESLRRKTPINYIMLSIFTIAESYVVATFTSRFDPESVVMAGGITTVLCLGLTIFAFQTKWDFTMMGGILFVGCILLLVFGLVASFFPGRTMILVYSSCGALLFCVYLIYDTQMMMGGKHKHSISPEEYVFAAITLYLDVINIFMYILSIIGASKD